jgi:hypothetical protein
MSPLFGASGGTDTATPAEGASVNGAAPREERPDGMLAGVSSLTAARPEIVLAAAFAGGVALAILVRRLGR